LLLCCSKLKIQIQQEEYDSFGNLVGWGWDIFSL